MNDYRGAGQSADSDPTGSETFGLSVQTLLQSGIEIHNAQLRFRFIFQYSVRSFEDFSETWLALSHGADIFSQMRRLAASSFQRTS